jgi:hypothetical protein
MLLFEADIHLRLLHTSIGDIYKVFEPLVYYLKGIWGHPHTVTPAKLAPDLVSQCHNIMFEADIYLRLLQTSILDIYKVFEPFVCCLKGIWVQPYSITLAKSPLDLGIQVHLRSGNGATTSWLRLISTSDYFIHPY